MMHAEKKMEPNYNYKKYVVMHFFLHFIRILKISTFFVVYDPYNHFTAKKLVEPTTCSHIGAQAQKLVEHWLHMRYHGSRAPCRSVSQ